MKDKKRIPNRCETYFNDLLDKKLASQEKEQEPSFLKKIIYIVTGICVVIFVILICVSIYKNNFSTESILSMLLAFFSIFISIFFYFKADETSTRFYDSSYKFMKEISVTLGKIEERFGEKLNSLDDKVSHLDRVSRETSAEIEDKQEDKDKIINELMERANLSEEERDKYRKSIEEMEIEIETLKEHKFRAEREADLLRHTIVREKIEEERCHVPKYVLASLLTLLQEENGYSRLTEKEKKLLRRSGIVDADGNIDKKRVVMELNRLN